jgi:hypothetical protein
MDNRASRIGEAFAGHATGAPASRLCDVCVEVLHVSGAGITVMSGQNVGPVCSSNARVSQLEELQFSLGEGPCHDAFATGETVSEPDLDRRSPEIWPNYTRPALDLGACAVFAFPLRVGTTRIGVLTLYEDEAGPLSAEQTADSIVTADVVAETMSLMNERGTPPFMTDEHGGGFDASRTQVHQASGVVAVQLGISVAEALVRIRAHAYASEHSVASVAREIVAHRLTLDDDGTKAVRDHPG